MITVSFNQGHENEDDGDHFLHRVRLDLAQTCLPQERFCWICEFRRGGQSFYDPLRHNSQGFRCYHQPRNDQARNC